MFGRRSAATLLALVAGLALMAGLLLTHARGTLFDESYLSGELASIDAYAFVEDDLYPAFVADSLDRLDERLPAALEGLDVPRDGAARASMTAVLRTAAPASYLQQQTEALLGGLLPYLRGETDGFAVAPDLGERLTAVTERPSSGRPSVLEVAFRELDLGTLVVQRLIDGASADADSDGSESAGLGVPVGFSLEESGDWFTSELFGAVDALLPYLTGESESFFIDVNFEGQEFLALPLAGLLRREPGELRADGFRLSDGEIVEQLGGLGSEANADFDSLRSGFSGSWTLTENDLLGDEDPAADLAALNTFRDRAALAFGPLRWGAFALAALLLVATGLLAGRRWPTRLIWGVMPLITTGLSLFVLAGPIYDAIVAPQLHEALVESSAEWAAPFAAHQGRIVGDAETLVAGVVGGFARLAGGVALLGVLLVTGGAVWAYRTRPTHEGMQDGTQDEGPAETPSSAAGLEADEPIAREAA